MAHNLGAAKRLRKELQNLEQNKKSAKAQNEHDDIILRPTNLSKSILHWTALLRGPPDTPYEDGVFHISIKCNSDYPLSPPTITFVTPIFHPNIHFKTGDVCLDILKKEWSPAWGLQAACRAVLALLSDPDADSPLNCDAGNLVRNGDMTAYWCTARMYTVENAMMLSWPNHNEEEGKFNSRILYYKKQLRLANEALEDQKEEFTKKMKMFDDREKVMREKDLCLQESIVQSHEVIKDNEETKTKATKRISEERRRCEEIDQAISDVQTAMRRKKDEEQELIALLDQKLRYKQYLEEVVDYAKQQISSEDFADIQDILDRYSTLKSMNEYLVSKMEVNMNEHDARRLSYAQFMKNSGNEILNMNNDVARLQKELELVNVMADKMESLEFGSHQNSTEVMTDISQVLLVIDNMIERLQCHAHSSLSNKSRLPKISAMEEGIDKKVRMASERLDLIADLINDYDSILANTKTKGFMEEGKNFQ